jgi:hypothetical protein
MAEWISVKERLPKRRQDVLCFIEEECQYYHIEGGSPYWTVDYFVCEGYYDSRRKEWYIRRSPDLSSPNYGVTHWMPLPEPPQEGGGE